MTQAPDGRLDPALRRLIGVVLLGGMMGILDATMVAVAADTLATRFDASLRAISWVSTAYLLALTIAIPAMSWAVDRFGGRKLWLAGLIVFLTGSLASGLAWNVGSLIAFRILQGLGAGMLDPLVLVLLARAAGPQRAGRVMGLMGVVLSLGPVLGPVLGGVVLQAASWRWMFLINLPVGLIAFLGALRVVPSDPPEAQRSGIRLDVLGLALLGPGFASLLLALTQSAEQTASGFAAPPVLAALVVGVVLLAAYAVHALAATSQPQRPSSRPASDRARRTPPLIDLRLFASRGFAASVTVMGLVGLATFSSLFVLPLYYQQLHGHGQLAAGLLVAPVGVGAAISMPLAGRLSDRLGARGLARWGALVAALGAFTLTRIGAQTPEVWPALAALAMGLGLGCVGAPTMGSLYRTLPADKVGQGSSVLYNLNQLGAAVGIAVVALIMDTAGDGDPIQGVHGVSWFVTGTILVVVAASLLLPGRPEIPAAVGSADASVHG